MPKILVVERPNEDPLIYAWDDGIKNRFKLDATEVEWMTLGNLLWRGSTAFALEEKPEVMENA